MSAFTTDPFHTSNCRCCEAHARTMAERDRLKADLAAARARVAELERELTLEEQRVADMMADVNRVGHENDVLRQDLAAARAECEHFKNCISAREVRAMVDERNKAWSNLADARVLLKQANEMLAEAIVCGPKLRKRIDAFLDGKKND